MNCSYHENVKSDYECKQCGRMICNECAVYHNDNILCKECAEKQGLVIVKNGISKSNTDTNNINGLTRYYTRKVSPFWTTIFSFIPGAGHMYLGLMKRGVQLMFIFFGIIAISGIFNSASFLTTFLFLVWFYSVFDCYHTRKKIQQGEIIEDEMIIDMNLNQINNYQVGIGLVGIGGLLLLDQIFAEISHIYVRLGIQYNIFGFLRDALFPGALILIGVMLLKKAKKGIDI